MTSAFHPLLRGAIELHCHSAPSIFARRQTDRELAADLKAAGMAGALLKSHESPTAERASLVREREPDLALYGGLACNYFTGGLSPLAVDTAIRLGAKCIWMPTISAQEHYDHFAHVKTKLFDSGRPVSQPPTGLKIWDGQERILPEVYEILNLIAAADIILATGHLSPREVEALADAAFERGVKKVLVQHADMGIAKIPLGLQEKLASRGAIIEKCYLACGDDFHDLTIAEMAGTIRRLGPASCVMVTDHGQAHNPPVVRAFSDFVSDMLACGLSEADVTQMIVTNPKKLLGIS